jgi:transcriptional regulator with XRE-family HTH domain
MREWLKELRIKKQLSQQTVAALLNITQQHYSLIENDERQKDMSIGMAEKLSGILDVPLKVILENERKE